MLESEGMNEKIPGYNFNRYSGFNFASNCKFPRLYGCSPRTINGTMLSAQGNYNEAIQHFDKAIMLCPQYANAWNFKGNALIKLGKYDEAVKCFDNATNINPQEATFWIDKGDALDKLGKYYEAIQAFDKVINISPQYANAWNNKGNALDKLGKYDEAIQNKPVTKQSRLIHMMRGLGKQRQCAQPSGRTAEPTKPLTKPESLVTKASLSS